MKKLINIITLFLLCYTCKAQPYTLKVLALGSPSSSASLTSACGYDNVVYQILLFNNGVLVDPINYASFYNLILTNRGKGTAWSAYNSSWVMGYNATANYAKNIGLLYGQIRTTSIGWGNILIEARTGNGTAPIATTTFINYPIGNSVDYTSSNATTLPYCINGLMTTPTGTNGALTTTLNWAASDLNPIWNGSTNIINPVWNVGGSGGIIATPSANGQSCTFTFTETMPISTSYLYGAYFTVLGQPCAGSGTNSLYTKNTTTISKNPYIGENITACVGTTQILSVNVLGDVIAGAGKIKYTYQWKKNGVNVPNIGGVNTGTNKTYDIATSGVGNYICEVKEFASVATTVNGVTTYAWATTPTITKNSNTKIVNGITTQTDFMMYRFGTACTATNNLKAPLLNLPISDPMPTTAALLCSGAIGWQGAKTAGIIGVDVFGALNWNLKVYEVYGTGANAETKITNAPLIVDFNYTNDYVGQFRFNDYSIGFNSSNPPFYGGVANGTEYFREYHIWAESQAGGLAAYSAKTFCVELGVNVGGCIVSKKAFFKIATNMATGRNWKTTNNNIEDLEPILNELIISPNPSNGVFNFQSDILTPDAQLTIYDNIGRQVISNYFIRKSAGKVDLSQNSNGVYYYKLIDNGQLFKGKLVKE